METRNCVKCGKLFSTIKSTSICTVCEKKEEEDFQVVRAFIDENPLSTTIQVSEATGISVKKIVRYIKEGRLEVTKGMQGEITCDVCGKPLLKGRFCDSCRIKLDQEVKGMFAADAAKDNDSKHKFFTANSNIKLRKKL